MNIPERILLGPGPSTVPARVLAALASPTLGHLDPAYLAIMDETRGLLKKVFRTDNQLTLGAEYRRRRYPEGRLRDRSRTSADASAGWVHSLLDGSGSLTITAHGGQHFATNRPDGNSSFYGATAALDFTVNNKLGWGTFAWWERDAYNVDRVHFHPDTLDNSVVLRRKDNLYEVGAYLVWEFAPSWTLRPEILWIRDQSNSVGFNYSATEFWLNVRKGF